MLSSTGSSRHVHVEEVKWEVVSWKRERNRMCDHVARTSLGDRGAHRNVRSDSAKKLVVELPATMELGLHSAAIMMYLTILSSLHWS